MKDVCVLRLFHLCVFYSIILTFVLEIIKLSRHIQENSLVGG